MSDASDTARLDQMLQHQTELLAQFSLLSGRVTDIDERQQATAAAAAAAVAQAGNVAAAAAAVPPPAPAAPAAPGPAKCAVPKPERFSGDSHRSETAHNWASTMTTYLDIHRLLDSMEGPKHAGMFFTGSAASWWHSLTGSNPQPITNWEEMKQAFLDYFSSTRQGKDAFRRLTGLEQRGSVRDYVRRFRDEALQVDSGLLTPANKLYYFINGLKVDLRTHVETLNPATHDEAVRIAEAAESAQTFANRGRRTEHSKPERQERRAHEPHVARERTTSREFREPGAQRPGQRPPPPRQPAQPRFHGLDLWSLELCLPATKLDASTTPAMPYPAALQRARETDKPGGGGSVLRHHKGAILQAPTKAPQAATTHAATILYLDYIYTADGSSA